MTSKIENIRSRCSIGWLWRLLDLPGKPSRNCRSPFRDDKDPSFSVYAGKDGERYFDHGTGKGGDVVDFYAEAHGITNAEAIDKLSGMIGLETDPLGPPQGKYQLPAVEKTPADVQWPADLRRPTDLEIESLGMLRGLLPAAFDLANHLGCLKVGTHYGELLWFLTDASKKGGEGKTFSGEVCISSGNKVAALKGTSKGWLYGLTTDLQPWNAIDKLVLVEGLPDWFAALALLIDYPGNARPVTMLGARNNISADCQQHLKGKTVLIIPHCDEKGEEAVKKWVDQLLGFDARVFSQTLPTGKDLNEFLVSPGNNNPLDLLKELE